MASDHGDEQIAYDELLVSDPPHVQIVLVVEDKRRHDRFPSLMRAVRQAVVIRRERVALPDICAIASCVTNEVR